MSIEFGAEKFNSIQELLLEKIQDNDYKIDEGFKKIQETVDIKFINFEKVLSSFTLKIDQIQNKLLADNSKVEKITDLVKFKDEAEDYIFNIKEKIMTINSDLEIACTKYDKIFIENLEVPGIIGEYNKYKNLRDYIEVITKNKCY